MLSLDCPAGFLREHVNVPAAPAQLAVNEKGDCAEHCDCSERQRRSVSPRPRAYVPYSAPAILKNGAHDGISGARHTDDPRRRHDNAVQSGENFREPSFCAAPINKTNQHHEEERLGITGDEIKCSRMGNNRDRAEKAQCRREFPTFAKEKEIGPKSPGR